MDVKGGLIVSIMVSAAGIIAAVELYDAAHPNGADVGKLRLYECMMLCQVIVLVVLLAIW